jgi:acyl dehydratase
MAPMYAQPIASALEEGLMADLPNVGHKVSVSKTISAEDVEGFARVSGDDQRLHLDDGFAARTRFGKRLAHGMLSAGLISAALGTKLCPDSLVVYLGQTLQFRRPVFIGDTVRAEAEVTAVDPEKRILTVRTDCVNQSGEIVVRGEATVLVDELKP